jgi:hypothetical protein
MFQCYPKSNSSVLRRHQSDSSPSIQHFTLTKPLQRFEHYLHVIDVVLVNRTKSSLTANVKPMATAAKSRHVLNATKIE